jgi:hypothetical protein
MSCVNMYLPIGKIFRLFMFMSIDLKRRGSLNSSVKVDRFSREEATPTRGWCKMSMK